MVHRNSVRALERSADGTATAVGGEGDNGGISVTRWVDVILSTRYFHCLDEKGVRMAKKTLDA